LSKTLGWLASSFLVFTFGYTYLLPQSFEMLAAWLAPLLGLGLRTTLVSLYLLYGDPFRDVSLLAAWLSAAFVGGLIARRGLRGIGVAVSTYSAIHAILGLSVLAVLQTLQPALEAGPEGLRLPPVPPGFSFPALFNAPVVGPGLRLALDMLAATQPFDPKLILEAVGEMVVVNAVKVLALACVAGLAGGLLGGFLAKKASGRGGSEAAGFPASKALALILLLTLTASTSLIPLGSAQASPFKLEALGGLISSDGSVAVASALVASELNLGVQTPNPQLDGLILAILLTQSFPPDKLPSLPLEGPLPLSGGWQSLYAAAPPTVLVVVEEALGEGGEAGAAPALSSQLSAYFNLPLTYLTAVPLDWADRAYRVAVYWSEASYTVSEEKLMGVLAQNPEGFASYVYDVYRNGTFTPGSQPWSADGSLVAVGLVNAPKALQLLEEGGFLGQAVVGLTSEQEPLGSLIRSFTQASQPVPFFFHVSFWERSLHSSPQQHTFNLFSFLRNSKPPTAASDSHASFFFIAAPSAVEPAPGWLVLEEGAVLKLLRPGEPLSEATVSFERVFPADLKVSKQVEPVSLEEGDFVQVRIEIRNEGLTPVFNLQLDDSEALENYGSAVRLVDGSLKAEWAQLEGGTAVVHTYTLTLRNLGVYTFQPAEVSYVYRGENFEAASNAASVEVEPPGVFQVWGTGILFSWKLAGKTIDAFLPGYGSILATLASAAVAAAIVYSVFRSFRRKK
jgi:hypothetical protein